MHRILRALHCRKLLQAPLLRFAEQRGLDVAGITVESGSGLEFNRAGLREVSKAVMDGRIDTLLVSSISRIGRNTGKAMEYLEWLREHGVILITLDVVKPFMELMEVWNSIMERYGTSE